MKRRLEHLLDRLLSVEAHDIVFLIGIGGESLGRSQVRRRAHDKALGLVVATAI